MIRTEGLRKKAELKRRNSSEEQKDMKPEELKLQKMQDGKDETE